MWPLDGRLYLSLIAFGDEVSGTGEVLENGVQRVQVVNELYSQLLRVLPNQLIAGQWEEGSGRLGSVRRRAIAAAGAAAISIGHAHYCPIAVIIWMAICLSAIAVAVHVTVAEQGV